MKGQQDKGYWCKAKINITKLCHNLPFLLYSVGAVAYKTQKLIYVRDNQNEKISVRKC